MTSTSPLGDDRPNTTPLEAEDFAQLIPTDVATRSDLNAVERDNILAARLWAFTGHPFKSVGDLLHETALDDIHRRMLAMSGDGRACDGPERRTSASTPS